MSASQKTCPSARAEPGAILLGIMGPDGRIKPLRTQMRIDADFIAAAETHGPPEARMRFASPCQTTGCTQWANGGCGVVEKVLSHLAVPEVSDAALPPCLIRATCRWFSQRGGRACTVCDLVVTDQAQAQTLAAAE
jgi:hypothetical protein